MRVQMRSEIIKLHRRLKATMIYVTHDQIEAMTMGDRIVVMKDGVVQQIDAPLKLYNQPANLFVAGFLGSPPMGFVKGTLEVSGGGALFREIGGGALECHFDDRPGIKGFIGKEVILGIRPEGLKLAEAGSAVPNRFQAVVEIVEPMGAETNIYLTTGAHSLICRTEATVEHGDVGRCLQFEIKLAKTHLFDPVTTNRIL